MTEQLYGFLILGGLSTVSAIVSLVGMLASKNTEHRLTAIETELKLLECRRKDCVMRVSQ